VQSLAYQTFRQALPPDVARERFEARLLSLSRTHNLLNESQWQGASLRDVLALELEPYTSDRKNRLVASGPDLDLAARTAVVLGMILHELATNAVKYGSLSVPDGSVEVRWWVAHATNRTDRLLIEWVERNGPPVAQPKQRGFGSRLIEQAARRELDGRAEVRYSEAGLTVSLDVEIDGQVSTREAQQAA